jgi:hypothetical protein
MSGSTTELTTGEHMRRILLMLVLLGCTAAAPLAAQRHAAPPDSAAGATMGQAGGMMNHAMMARMDSLGARLDSLTRVMNRVTGPSKVNAMAEVLTTLVGHHLEMQRHMHERMMGGGSGGHSGSGGMNCSKDGQGKGAEPAHNH